MGPLAQCEGFNRGKWIALGDEEGYVSILDGTSPLPAELCPAEPDAPRPTAQWLAHHNAIFDLAWCQVRHRSLGVSWRVAPMVPYPDLCLQAQEASRTINKPYHLLHFHQSLRIPPSPACLLAQHDMTRGSPDAAKRLQRLPWIPCHQG